MALTINHLTKVISVPKADLTLIQSVPSEIRELDLNWFRLQLKDLEDDPEGMVLPNTHNHVAPITVGSITLARVVELINGFTVTFEDGQYAVNLVGANTNVGDLTNVNQVSVRPNNSAGLIQVDSGSVDPTSLANAVWNKSTAGPLAGSYGAWVQKLLSVGKYLGLR